MYLKQFQSKHFLLITLCMGLVYFTEAQENVVDIEPDEVITGTSPVFSIDFAEDGFLDFAFRVQIMVGDTVFGGQPASFDGASAIVECLNGQPVGVTASSIFGLSNLNQGDVVSSADEFGIDSSYSLGINLLVDADIGLFPYLYGSFLDASNKYLGVRFIAGTNTHYGWIELSVSAGADSITIHSYGYNETPDEMIDAGVLGINSTVIQNNIKIWNELESIYIGVIADLIGNEYSIVSISGNEVHSGVFDGLQTKINVNHFSKGIYNVLIDTSLGQISKRIYIP